MSSYNNPSSVGIKKLDPNHEGDSNRVLLCTEHRRSKVGAIQTQIQ